MLNVCVLLRLLLLILEIPTFSADLEDKYLMILGLPEPEE